MQDLATEISAWASELGFQAMGITDIDLSGHETRLMNWLQNGYHGEMDYMQRHGTRRSRPADLMPGTVRVISVRMDYWPEPASAVEDLLQRPDIGFISRYALGRDYHKVMRQALQKLADRISGKIGKFGYRAFVDSAPVLEKALAEKAGLGWIGKHSNLLNKDAGGWFFLGELYTDLPLPVDSPADNHCGSCSRCIDVCPTQAIVAPYQVDARRCISYLTIELRGSIPVEFRKAMGNRIYGCDDCQAVCPWNKFSQPTGEEDFLPREPLDAPQLLELFAWPEAEFLRRMEGSAIRRIGYECWQRNIAVALGNAPGNEEIVSALKAQLDTAGDLVREHIEWALEQQNGG